MYSALLPIITIIHAGVDTSLAIFWHLHPVYAVVGAVLFACAWLVNLPIWVQCMGDGSYENSTCPEWPMEMPRNGATNIPRTVFGAVIVILYLVYIGFGAAAVHKANTMKRERRYGRKMANDMGSAESVDHV
ncbi:MAG: hypothetical protein M1837_003246 [Sclerophora amabilis]|nr:MAG: hypothetical protein M1837_003246 [Sclerophora amabilis]